MALLVLGLLYVGGRRLEHLRYVAGDALLERFCGLRRLNHEVVADELVRLDLPRLTLDVDGTVIRTGSQVAWAFRGFNPHHRKDPS